MFLRKHRDSDVIHIFSENDHKSIGIFPTIEVLGNCLRSKQCFLVVNDLGRDKKNGSEIRKKNETEIMNHKNMRKGEIVNLLSNINRGRDANQGSQLH